MLKMMDLDLANQRVLIREDLNVPMQNGVITDDTRIRSALPTIKFALKANARVMIMSHLGRPIEGQFDPAFSLKPIAAELSKLLGKNVPLIPHWLEGVDVAPGEVVLFENVRFCFGEEKNFPELAERIAALCDIFVMDAFATVHRAQASTCGVAEYAKIACAGPLLMSELTALDNVLEKPKKPVTAIVGGSKVSTKIALLDALLSKVDQLIVGGGIANTLLKAQGYEIGRSLYERDWVKKAEELLHKAQLLEVAIPLPVDVVVAHSLGKPQSAKVKSIADVTADDAIFDVGPKTAAHYRELLQKSNTILWNGPVGVFEIEAFSHGTRALAEAIAESSAYSLAGGGDTLAALAQFHLTDKISYVSTGGGAFLAYLEGETLPALKALSKSKRAL